MKYSDKITDKFGRTHDYLRISLTERCNLRCTYCMPEQGIPLREKSEFMTAKETIEIAKVFVSMGIKKIRLTGGEPLINKGAALIIKELGKLPVELAITTNGILLDRFIDVLQEANVKSVNVSLDSLREKQFNQITRRDYFRKVMTNIDLLLKNDFTVKVNAVLIKGINDDEITDFIEWTRHTNIHVRFIEFMPFDGNNWDWNKKVSYREILNEAKAKFGTENILKLPEEKNKISRNFKIENGLGTFGIISTVTNPFCDSCNRIRLTADGKIKNCLFSTNELDLLKVHRANLPLLTLIEQAIASKHKEHGGNGKFNNKTAKTINNRSMIRIGG